MPYRPTNFRLIVIKPYYTDESSKHDITITVENEGDDKDTITIELDTANKENNKENNNIEQATKPVRKRGRSRPRKHAVLISAIYITTKK